ncbi:transposase [Bradyrhizobium sp. SBR1B]|nr:transposase [Bradyrhizobium sp. SBR1B]
MRIGSQNHRRTHPQAGAGRKTSGVRDRTLSVWFYHSLRTEGLPAICIDARHAKAALDMAANKTDANDADGLAQLGSRVLS